MHSFSFHDLLIPKIPISQFGASLFIYFNILYFTSLLTAEVLRDETGLWMSGTIDICYLLFLIRVFVREEWNSWLQIMHSVGGSHTHSFSVMRRAPTLFYCQITVFNGFWSCAVLEGRIRTTFQSYAEHPHFSIARSLFMGRSYTVLEGRRHTTFSYAQSIHTFPLPDLRGRWNVGCGWTWTRNV